MEIVDVLRLILMLKNRCWMFHYSNCVHKLSSNCLLYGLIDFFVLYPKEHSIQADFLHQLLKVRLDRNEEQYHAELRVVLLLNLMSFVVEYLKHN